MPSQYDNSDIAENVLRHTRLVRGAGCRRRMLCARRAAFARRRNLMLASRRKISQKTEAPIRTRPRELNIIPAGYDPELLYVECGRCGSPVLWSEGKATTLLRQAGIDPMELDPSCIMVTDACPACGTKEEYSVRIFRIAPSGVLGLPPTHGNA